jgi:DNA-binding NtrC family response regulator
MSDSPTPPPAPPSPAPHLLVVDDEEIVLVALRQTLTQLGYRVTAASDAIQGLGRLREQEYAAVISDHQMPTLTGLEFLAQVRELQPEASRILITAVLNLGTVIEAINKAEIFRFLIKPWEREELIRTVRAAVEHHQVLRTRREMLAAALRENQALQARVQALEAELGQPRTPRAP